MIRIEAYELEYNISAKNWLVRHLIDYGYVVEGIKEYNWRHAEALGYIYNKDTPDFKVRVVARMNGDRLLIMKYSAPSHVWEAEKSYQATVARSFNFTSPDTYENIEMLEYDITGYVEFVYPETLQVGQLNQKDFDRPRVKFFNREEAQEEYDEAGRKIKEVMSKGIINFQVVIHSNTNTSLADEIEEAKKDFEKLGIKVNKKLSHDVNLLFPYATKINRLDIFQGESIEEKNPGYEIWIAYMTNEEAYYIVTMVTPSADSRYFAWNENKSAFEAIVSSIEPISLYEE
jgi:hypothetical protein